MVEILQEYIRIWLQAKKHRSLKQLAEGCGLNYGTIRNMADGKAVPNGETILRVLLAVTTVDNIHAFVQEHLPHLTPYTKALTDYGTRVAQPISFTRKHSEVLMEISFGPATLESLTAKYGPSAPGAVEDLVQAEIVNLIEDRYHIQGKTVFVPSQQLALEHSRIVLDNMNINLKGNMILGHSAGLSIEAVREVYSIMDKARDEALRIMNDPKNQGENRTAVSFAMTLL